jgi:ABC-type spermidine/putrescine transport system permease subunit I
MVLPLYSALEKMDGTLIEAAQDLGCPPITAFWKITFPLSLPGVIAGCCWCSSRPSASSSSPICSADRRR